MRVRRMAAGFAAAATIGAVSIAVAGPVGASAGTACDRGYEDPGAVTYEESLELDRIQAGLAADPAPYTESSLAELFAVLDGNEDGLICLKAVSNLRGNSVKHWGFFYTADDNTHPGAS